LISPLETVAQRAARDAELTGPETLARNMKNAFRSAESYPEPTGLIADGTALVGLFKQLADAVWRRREDFDRMIRSIRGEPEPGEKRAGRRPRLPWMRDAVRYEPGRRYVVDNRRERPLLPVEAYRRIGKLPISVLVGMFVDALGARVRLTVMELDRAKAKLAKIFKEKGERFNPDGTEQHRRRFFQRLIGIGERELGVGQRGRRAAARRRRMPPRRAMTRQQQRDAIKRWAHQYTIPESDATLPKAELMANLMLWWRASCNGIPAPSAKLLTTTFGRPKKVGKHHAPVFVGLKLRAKAAAASAA
jgi:hypothetical protein